MNDQKYELTAENCTSWLAEHYKYQPEMLLMRFARYYEEVAMANRNKDKKNLKLFEIAEALEKLAKRLRSRCYRCNTLIIDGNGFNVGKGEIVCPKCMEI